MANELKKIKYLNSAGVEGDKQDNVILDIDKLRKVEAADFNNIRNIVNAIVDIINGTNKLIPSNFPIGDVIKDLTTSNNLYNDITKFGLYKIRHQTNDYNIIYFYEKSNIKYCLSLDIKGIGQIFEIKNDNSVVIKNLSSTFKDGTVKTSDLDLQKLGNVFMLADVLSFTNKLYVQSTDENDSSSVPNVNLVKALINKHQGGVKDLTALRGTALFSAINKTGIYKVYDATTTSKFILMLNIENYNQNNPFKYGLFIDKNIFYKVKIDTSGNITYNTISTEIAATAKRAADQVRHEIGLNPTRAFHDFSTLGESTTNIINVYDNNSLTSEYGIFNALIAKMENLKLEEFAVKGRIDDTNNALFSLFFKQILSKRVGNTDGDFNKLSDPRITSTLTNQIITFGIKKQAIDGLWHIYFHILRPENNFSIGYACISNFKNENGNWDNSFVYVDGTADQERENFQFSKYHEYVDEREMFIQSNGKITTVKKWKNTKDLILGVNYNLSLLTITFKNGQWQSLDDGIITIDNWNATAQELSLNLPYKFGGYIQMRGRMKYSPSAVNCEIAFKDRTQSDKYYHYLRSGTQNGNAPTLVGYPNENANRNYFIIFEGGDVGKARIINGEFAINDDQVECSNFETINIKNTEFYKAKVDAVYDRNQNPFRNDSTKKIVLQFRNVNNKADIKDGSFISLTMTKGSVANW